MVDDVAQVTLLVEGMHCASCVNKIETALMKHPAIIAASVNSVTKQAKVPCCHGATHLIDLGQRIEF